MQTNGLVSMIVPGHIVAGGLALLCGYVALTAAKGATLHRRSGMLFVAAMSVMALSGALMEALDAFKNPINVVAGLLTFYFVTTALLTVRRRPQASPWRDRAAALFALIVSVLAFGAGFGLASRGRPEARRTFRGIGRVSAPDVTAWESQ